jgi:NADH-quinone oxidoreductase subunit C
MRKDYAEPDDYEWEPTPHGDVHKKAMRHYPAEPAATVVTAEPSPSVAAKSATPEPPAPGAAR